MPIVGFPLPVNSRTVAAAVLGLTCTWAGTRTSAANDAAAPPADTARAAMRKEASARERQMKAQFARLKALPNPPPAPVAQAPLQVQVIQARQAVMLLEEFESDEDEDDDAPRAPVRRVFSESAFDVYLLGGNGSIEIARARLDGLLEREIEAAATTHRLTPSEKEKLHVAGKGDIKRYFDKVEAKRKEFDKLRHDLVRANTFLNDLRVLGAMTRYGVWGKASLFDKVLSTIDADKRGRS